jgi:hypothetical protein
VHPAVQDIELLLAASRSLVVEKKLDFERLQAWGTERERIFTRLKDHHSDFAGDNLYVLATLMTELRGVDAKICARVMENQRLLAEQIGTVRKMRQALGSGTAHLPQLLQRLA